MKTPSEERLEQIFAPQVLDDLCKLVADAVDKALAEVLAIERETEDREAAVA